MADILNLRGPDGQWVGIPAIVGPEGKSAYDVAVENGFEGTKQEWLESLKGMDGTMSFEDLTEEQRESLRGPKGDPGEDSTVPGPTGPAGAAGADGKSAYQIAVDSGYQGTQDEWLLSLHGQDGAPGDKGDKGDQGERGVQGPAGANGSDYVITDADYTAIANIVLGQLTNAEQVSY